MKKIELETDVDDRTFRGFRVIKSNKAGKFQIIYLTEDIYERDGGSYTDPNSTIALFAAKNILRSLVQKHQP
jgi:hypothetical protein